MFATGWWCFMFRKRIVVETEEIQPLRKNDLDYCTPLGV